MVRINALIRRAHAQPAGPLNAGGILLDETTMEAQDRTGARHALTATEFRLLRYFMLHPGQVLSKTRLSEHVYDYDSDKDSNVLEVYVNRLRKKLGRELIETKRGQGYIFDAGTGA